MGVGHLGAKSKAGESLFAAYCGRTGSGEAPWDFPEEVAEWPCPALPHLGLQSPVTGPAGTHPGCLGCGEGRGGDRWLDICGESAGSL